MHIALLIFYSCFFAFIFFKWKKLSGNAWIKGQLSTLFIIKLCCGFAYGYAANHYYAPDAFVFFSYATEITQLAYTQTADYLSIVFGPINHTLLKQHVSIYDDFAVWHNLGSFTMVRINAIFNLFSGSNFYINIVFWNVLSTIGIALIWQCIYCFANYGNPYVKAFLCLSPEMLFWASGPHKEGISLFCIGLLLWSFFNLVHKKNWAYLLLFIAAAFLQYATRYYFLALLLPCFLAYAIYHLQNLKQQYYWLILSVLFFIAIIADFLMLNNYVLSKIILMRNEFIHVLKGNTDFSLSADVTNYWDAFLQIPYALFNAFMRPLLIDSTNLQSLLAAFGKWLMIAPAIYALTQFKKWLKAPRQLVLFIGYALIVMLVIGLIVDNSGAMVRYRSIPLTLFTTSLLMLVFTNEKKVHK